MNEVKKEVLIKPGYYWFHESVPLKYGQAFEITLPTKFKVVGEKEHHYIVVSVGRINTPVKVFEPGEMILYVGKDEYEIDTT